MTPAQIWDRVRRAAAHLHVITRAGGRVPSVGGTFEGRSYQKQVALYQHYGFRSHPPEHTELVTVAPGATLLQEVAIASELPGAGPADQPKGDVEVYAAPDHGYTLRLRANGAQVLLDGSGQIDATAHGSEVKIDSTGNVDVSGAAGARVQLRANGATITISATGAISVTAAGGQALTLNGGVAHVARVGDTVAVAPSMAGWIAAINAALLAGGLGLIPPPTDFGTIATGAATVNS